MTPDNDNKYLKEDPDGGGRGHRFLRSGAGARSISEAAQLGMRSTLFDGVVGRKVARSALEPAAPAPVKAEETNVDLTLKSGKGQQGDQSDHRHDELVAVVDAIKVAPRSEGKKRSKRRLGPT